MAANYNSSSALKKNPYKLTAAPHTTKMTKSLIGIA